MIDKMYKNNKKKDIELVSEQTVWALTEWMSTAMAFSVLMEL